MAKLFVLSGSSIGETFDLDGTSVIGRSPEVDITVLEGSISRRHARLVPQAEPGLWGLVDLDSSNGVFVEGKRVAKAKVRDGMSFVLGDVEFRLRDQVPEAEPTARSRSGPSAPPVAPEPAPSLGTPDGGDGFELEFGDDLDGAIEAASAPVAPPKQPKAAAKISAAADRAGAKATAERAARRSAAMGSSARAAAQPAAGQETGRPILQYSQTRSGGTDLSQLSGLHKAVVILLAIAALGGAFYGAFLAAS